MVCIIISMIFCLVLPINGALNYVRCIYEDYACYMYRDIFSWTDDDDAAIVGFITIPSLIIIYAAFLHYALIALRRPMKHKSRILPIFDFNRGFLRKLGRILSYICIYTMPLLIPLGIYVVYNTKCDPESYVCNEIPSFLVYLFPAALMFGALLFSIFYIIYLKKMWHRKKNNYRDDTEDWFIC